MSLHNKEEVDDYQNKDQHSVTKKINPHEDDEILKDFSCEKCKNKKIENCPSCFLNIVSNNEKLNDLMNEFRQENQDKQANDAWQIAFFQKFTEKLNTRTNSQRLMDGVLNLRQPLNQSLKQWWQLFNWRKTIEERKRKCEEKKQKEEEEMSQTKEHNSMINDNFCGFYQPKRFIVQNNSKQLLEQQAKCQINIILQQIDENNQEYNILENLDPNNQKFDDIFIPMLPESLPNELFLNYFHENKEDSKKQKLILKQWRRYITFDFLCTKTFLSSEFRKNILESVQNQNSEEQQEIINIINSFKKFENSSQ